MLTLLKLHAPSYLFSQTPQPPTIKLSLKNDVVTFWSLVTTWYLAKFDVHVHNSEI